MTLIDYEAFQKISIIRNKNNLNFFIFFFVVALCGYASVLTSYYAYNDDYMRNVLNNTCAVNGRYGNAILEYLMYLSPIILDAAPFTQVVSCASLAFTALVCTHIFCKTIDKYCLLFFSVVVVNPYVIENMLFRFDNIFMMFALLCSVLAAYISTKNNPHNLPMQIILLLSSLFLYQGALPAYFIAFLHMLIEKISQNERLINCIKAAKYWVYTMLCTAVLYFPIAQEIDYTHRKQKLFEGECLAGYLKFILRKISCYFENIYDNWRHSDVSVIILVFVVGFILYFLIKTRENKTNYFNFVWRAVFLSVLIFSFFLAPMGLTICFNHAGTSHPKFVPPRVIYTIGIVIPIILYNASRLFEKVYFLRALYKFFSVIFLIWNVVFANGVGNLLNQKYSLQCDISKDISDDLYSIRKKHNISKIRVKWPACAFFNALVRGQEKYPILKSIIGHNWDKPIFSNILLKYNGEFYPNVEGNDFDLKKLTRIVDRMWYALYLFEDTLIIEIKEPDTPQ